MLDNLFSNKSFLQSALNMFLPHIKKMVQEAKKIEMQEGEIKPALLITYNAKDEIEVFTVVLKANNNTLAVSRTISKYSEKDLPELMKMI